MNWYILLCAVFMAMAMFGGIKSSDYPKYTKLPGWAIDTFIGVGVGGFIITCIVYLIVTFSLS